VRFKDTDKKQRFLNVGSANGSEGASKYSGFTSNNLTALTTLTN